MMNIGTEITVLGVMQMLWRNQTDQKEKEIKDT